MTFDHQNNRMRLTREGGPLTRKPLYRVGVMLAREQHGGVTVDGTVPGSPAERAGLLKGDRILQVNGSAINDLPPGEMGRVFGKPEEVLLVVQRGTERLELRLTPEKVD